MSDSAGMAGSFYVYTGYHLGEKSPTVDGQGVQIYTFCESLQELLTKEVLSIHKKPILRYDGTVVSNSNFGQRLVFDQRELDACSEAPSMLILMNGMVNGLPSLKTLMTSTTDDPVGTGGVTNETASRVSSQQGYLMRSSEQ